MKLRNLITEDKDNDEGENYYTLEAILEFSKRIPLIKSADIVVGEYKRDDVKILKIRTGSNTYKLRIGMNGNKPIHLRVNINEALNFLNVLYTFDLDSDLFKNLEELINNVDIAEKTYYDLQKREKGLTNQF